MTADGRPLRDSLDDYLALRRALGFRLRPPAGCSASSSAGSRTAAPARSPPKTPWHGRCSRPGHRRPGSRSGSARSAGSPPTCTAPTRRSRFPRPGLIRRGNDRATPYIYSDAEISAIIAAAGTLRPRFRAATYQALISLLAASGVFSRGPQPVA